MTPPSPPGVSGGAGFSDELNKMATYEEEMRCCCRGRWWEPFWSVTEHSSVKLSI